MKKFERIVFTLSIAFAIVFGITPITGAMHIMEGFLPAGHSIAWGVISAPFLLIGLKKLNELIKHDRKSMLLIAMIGAYAFMLSSLKIPSVTGSSSHPTGTGLGAILIGPAPMAVLGIIVLLFQALLLAHGGLTTLGANTFSMAIAGPFLSYGIYKLGESLKLNKLVSVFLASALGALFTYVVTSFQLALAHPSAVGGFMASFTKFMGVFAVTQIPLAIIEGLLTVVIVMGLESWAKPELKSIGFNA